MTKTLSITLSVCISSLTASAIIGGYFLVHTFTPQVSLLLRNWAEFPTKTEDAIAGPRGTLHEVNKAVVKIGDSIVTTQLAERKITPATVETVRELGKAAGKLGDAADALKGTANAGTESAQALSLALQTANEAIKGTGPLVEDLRGSVQRFNALLDSKDLSDGLHHLNGMSASGDVILGNTARVSTKAADDYMKAHTPWGRFVQTGWDLLDITAMGARHVK